MKTGLLALVLAAGLGACGDRQHVVESSSVAEATTTTVTKTADASGRSVTELPLKRGYYVSADTPCAQASNATVLLLRREGLGGSQDFCEFKMIEQTAPTTYRVTQSCGDLRGGGEETSVVTYDLMGDASFKSKSEHGWEQSARRCEQSSMPADWRENDISDVIG
jgi:hypothetical protein